MAANLPEITYRYPTLQSGPQSTPRPSIIFDWSTDMVTTQFSDDAQRSVNVILMDDAAATVLETDYVGYTAASRRVEIQPAIDLDPNRIYRILIKSKLQSSDGRKSFNEYHWTFQTASGAVNNTLSLYAPPDSTVQVTPPTLSWSAVTFAGSASGGVVSYAIQVSNRFDFGTLDYSTLTTSVTALPNHTYTDNTTYYWRVRAHTVGATGNWSDVWSYYYGRITYSTPETRQFLPDPDPFGIKKLNFKSGVSNVSSYPVSSFTITFYSAPASDYASYVETTKKSVLPRNDDLDTYNESTWAGAWSQSGSTLTFIPSEAIANNTRYEIKFLPEMRNTVGYELAEEYSFWLTSRYAPFYVSSRVIRSRFLGAEQKVPDDLINFYIYQASLEANARYWGFTPMIDTAGDSLSEATVRDSANMESYGVLKWVEAAASYKILKAILFEHLRDIGRTERLGDSLVSLTKDFIAGIDKALELVAGELEEWENFLTPSDIPTTVPKSYGWSPQFWNSDWSVMDLEAKRDDYF